MDSPSSRGMTGGGGVCGRRLFTALRCVHGYRETARGDRIKAGKAGKAGKAKDRKAWIPHVIPSEGGNFAGNDGCMGGFPGAVCSLRCALVHRYRETAKGIKQRRESKKRRDGKETAVVVIKLSQAPQSGLRRGEADRTLKPVFPALESCHPHEGGDPFIPGLSSLRFPPPGCLRPPCPAPTPPPHRLFTFPTAALHNSTYTIFDLTL